MQDTTFSEKLYTSTEVAQILGVSLRSIYRYLDENKIQAAVKTATGRHRFTKQNINDFLHPNANSKSDKTVEDTVIKQEPVLEEVTKENVADRKDVYVTKREVKKPEPEPEPEPESVKDEPIDWLARFRQAAEKYKTEAPVTVPSQKSSNIFEDREPEAQEKQDESVFYYYRSGVGGLKEIAQSLDKAAKNASLEYAFTLNSGLSLHKPIKPFSLIHSYVRPTDKPYFEKVLQLTPCQKDVAQLCLITTNDLDIYKGRKEMHGLYVVSDQQIKLDLLNEGETDLANEIE